MTKLFPSKENRLFWKLIELERLMCKNTKILEDTRKLILETYMAGWKDLLKEVINDTFGGASDNPVE